MRLTTKGRFAVTAMLDLAINGEGTKPITLASISERQHISLSYLEQIFTKLRRCGLVKSVRGPKGGYTLVHDTNDVSISQIVEAVEENLDATQCSGKGDCMDGSPCLSHALWDSLNMNIDNYLSSISLQNALMKHYPLNTNKHSSTQHLTIMKKEN